MAMKVSEGVVEFSKCILIIGKVFIFSSPTTVETYFGGSKLETSWNPVTQNRDFAHCALSPP